ncbi:hypothetical protein EDB19DRAFT_1715037 [Suillus lakei]|nr:hypothetical protein EDB19DRAFT_1715037 [Suillus lakei]
MHPHLADRMYDINWMGDMLNVSYFLGLESDYDTNGQAPALIVLTRKEQLKVAWKLLLPERLVKLELMLDKFDHWVDVAGSPNEYGKD